jgi:Sec-independent protein translocase protein TatA
LNYCLLLTNVGLGPAEIIVIGAAAALIFGPDRIKSQLRESGVKNQFTGEGWRAEQNERITLMREHADITRKQRSWVRINELIAHEEPGVLTRLTTFEDFKQKRETDV